MPEPDLPDYMVTPELVEFVRAELELAMSFTDTNGKKWNNASISRAISKSYDIAGGVDDETIRRFRNPNSRQKPSRTTVLALVGFLIATEFVSQSDFEHYSKPAYSRAAASIGALFAEGGKEDNGPIATELHGEYRNYRRYGEDRLIETVIVVASPDGGKSLTVSEIRSVHYSKDLDWVMSESDDLSFEHYHHIPELLEESDSIREIQLKGRGVAIATVQSLLFLIGGENLLAHSVSNFIEVAFNDNDRVTGLKGQRCADWIRSLDGKLDPIAYTDRVRIHWNKAFSHFVLYPQGKPGLDAPVFATSDEGMRGWKSRGEGLGFMAGPKQDVDDAEKQIVQNQAIETEIEHILATCKDATQRYFAAIDLLRADHAVKAVKEGADVNARHPTRDIPAIHCAASLGMRDTVYAILESGKCDLTVRDKHNRLASSCADNFAEDFELRDDLIAAQSEQFRERGIDPRRPNVPGYGSYTLS